MTKQEYKGEERQRRYYFFDYLFWLGEMAQWYFSLVFLLISEIILITTAPEWITEILK